MTTSLLAQTAHNRLSGEPSLYLQQHAENPVAWQPWGEAALARSLGEQRPILLSIGYSACHWCHVMERETFENPTLAAQMNELFVCIKVDREERPDLDQLYMRAVQAMTGHGGWPMTVFLTPGLEPFYAGTYFPPEDRGQLPGFGRVLAGVARAWNDRRDEVSESAGKTADWLRRELVSDRGAARAVDLDGLLRLADGLLESVDGEHGGFGSQPKFPSCSALDLLATAEAHEPDDKRRALLRLSWDSMADGGLHDHVGGGFHRYSVDRVWHVPHFEKMLYDQASLAASYLGAWKLTGHGRYLEVAVSTLDWLRRDMRLPGGGFAATLDADSEGVEGIFYTWTREQLADAVAPADFARACELLDVSEAGNWEGGGAPEPGNVLRLEALAGELSADDSELLGRVLPAMLGQRQGRVAPTRDDKVMADWNGLAAAAMAATGRAAGRADLVADAQAAVDFVLSQMRDGDGGLLHLHAGGSARVGGFLDDYAFMGRACLELFTATSQPRFLDEAKALGQGLLDRFAHAEGGFYFSQAGADTPLARTREAWDSAVPSGNAIALELLDRLYLFTAEEHWSEAAERSREALLGNALANPHGGAALLGVTLATVSGRSLLVIRGDKPLPSAPLQGEVRSLTAEALAQPLPGLEVLCLPDGTGESWLPAPVRGKNSTEGVPTAWLCRGTSCSAPVTGREELLLQLEQA